MSQPAADVARALADAARSINSARTLEDTLDAIVRATVGSVPGFDHVGISTVGRDGGIETKAATDRLVWDLDELQYDLDEGPCLSAMRSERVVAAPDIRHDQRWPSYVGEAVRLAGLKAQLAVQLHVDDETIGGLNLYSTSSARVGPEAVQTAELLATHAALALSRARRESNLSEALTARQEIGLAIGLTMARYKLDEERAFQYLVRASSTRQLKLRVIAREIIDRADAEHRTGDR